MNLADLTSPEVVPDLLVIPLGSTEQHGPHLPLSTDTVIASDLANRLAAARSQTTVAPAVPYGSSGEHAGFPGTLSVGRQALHLLLVELVRSADGFRRVLLLNGHGGNHDPVRRSVALLRQEGRDVRAWGPAFGGDAHAGRTETSVMLALGQAVRSERPRGNTEPVGTLLAAMQAGGVQAVSANGVLGDATGATVEEGIALMNQATSQLVAFVERW